MEDWDARYDTEEYRYGKKPVGFLTRVLEGTTSGKALCIGAGEGRNAVWLAEQGWQVTALDLSTVGLEKAVKLAESKGVSLHTVAADASEWNMGEKEWDLVTLFFVHAPPQIREAIHRRASAAVANGGLLVLEGFTPRQLERGTGGPGSKAPKGQAPLQDMQARFIEPKELPDQLPGLVVESLVEEDIELDGGTMHKGLGTVVHCVAARR